MKLRNIAIIAHVDHGKTTLVDQLFKQSGMFRNNQVVDERLMDSMDLEKERGITIRSKIGSCVYKDTKINIIDTPGHADFGGEVERILHMADAALFLVDAQEGPMPQSYFVLKNAIKHNLPIIVVVNKIDKPASRTSWVIDQVFDLMAELDAPDEILDFPVIYASARNGIATEDENDLKETMVPLFDKILDYVPEPKGEKDLPFQFQVSNLDYSSFLGRLAIGKITQGTLATNQEVALSCGENETPQVFRVTKIYQFISNEYDVIENAAVGDIIAIAGVEGFKVGMTVTDPAHPQYLPEIAIDPPTISMTFLVNSSPFAGQEGEFVTSNNILDRLKKAALSDVALLVDNLGGDAGFKVSGRGELHLSILVEQMRREGFEFQLSRPTVITKKVDGKVLEPFEELTIDIDESVMGVVMEQLASRKGQMISMDPIGENTGKLRLIYQIPTRGLLGYQGEFLMATKGRGIMGYIFLEYRPFSGDIKTRKHGVLIAKENCKALAFALDKLQDRGQLFIEAAEQVYGGQIIGKNAKEDDLTVNPGKGKKLTNMRASGSDDTVCLVPSLKLSLEQIIAFIDDSELVEVTPKSIRLRKKILVESMRKK
ncbi:translational GTPase TypA [bacterium]|jgi:GTP-binding protein|nr:translational GTPase TypA [bacterium]